jgi:hypothetical protein
MTGNETGDEGRPFESDNLVLIPSYSRERREQSFPLDRVNRELEEPDNQWTVAAFVQSHEPDEAEVHIRTCQRPAAELSAARPGIRAAPRNRVVSPWNTMD